MEQRRYASAAEKGRSPRKPAGQRHRPAGFLRAKIVGNIAPTVEAEFLRPVFVHGLYSETASAADCTSAAVSECRSGIQVLSPQRDGLDPAGRTSHSAYLNSSRTSDIVELKDDARRRISETKKEIPPESRYANVSTFTALCALRHACCSVFDDIGDKSGMDTRGNPTSKVKKRGSDTGDTNTQA
ncbi:hypothetical protein PR048_026312 [Dryococelus australis]|uniref:Uncharacterized protein n=1 Tax=Dryococelus australis TaxID=614101 RepID=A0ABQ9GL07_9NEOP|nr:hypothetical protein PR048_026312 [Dryococelus australis]